MIALYLLYLDESGNSGLEDQTQPFYVLGGILIRPDQWHPIEAMLEAIRSQHFKKEPANFEFHGSELEHRSRFRDRDRVLRKLLRIPGDLGVQVPLVAIEKQKYIDKYAERDANGDVVYELKKNYHGKLVPRVKIKGGDNHVLLAFRIMAEIIETKCNQENKHVIVFRDRDREHEHSLKETFHHIRANGTKLITGPLTRLIENIHFIDSKGNRCMQLADVCVYYATQACKPTCSPRRQSLYELLAPCVDPVLETVPRGSRTFHDDIFNRLNAKASVSTSPTGPKPS